MPTRQHIPFGVHKSAQQCALSLKKYCYEWSFKPLISGEKITPEIAGKCKKCGMKHKATIFEKTKVVGGVESETEGCSTWEVDYICGKLHAHSLAKAYLETHPSVDADKKGLFTLPELTPKGGFQSSQGETAACILDKAGQLVDAVHSLAHCQKWGSKTGLCYTNRPQEILQHLRMCCIGGEFIQLGPDEIKCKKAVVPLQKLMVKEILPLWTTCVSTPDAPTCTAIRNATPGFHHCIRKTPIWNKKNLMVGVKQKLTASDPACAHSTQTYFRPILSAYRTFVTTAQELFNKDKKDASEVATKLMSDCSELSGSSNDLKCKSPASMRAGDKLD